jgi:hypothetical protein
MGRLWYMEPNRTLLENIQMAIDYFKKTHGETFQEVRLKPFNRKDIQGDAVCSLAIVEDPFVPPGHMVLGWDSKGGE